MKKPSHYPEDASITFEGYWFHVYERKRKESDNKDYTYHKIHRKDSVSIFATQGNKILLPKFSNSRKGDYIGVFGGIIDERGADYMQKAKEELLEEAGMTSNNRLLYKSYNYHGFDGKVHFVIAKNCKIAEDQNLAGSEGQVEIIAVTLDRFLDMIDNEEIRGIPYCKYDMCKIRYDQKLRKEFEDMLFG